MCQGAIMLWESGTGKGPKGYSRRLLFYEDAEGVGEEHSESPGVEMYTHEEKGPRCWAVSRSSGGAEGQRRQGLRLSSK